MLEQVGRVGTGGISGVLRYSIKTMAHCDRHNYVSYSNCCPLVSPLDSVLLFLHSSIQSNLYFFHISSNNGLQPIDAPSFAHSKNDPDIFRWSEYVSSGGGDKR